MFVHYEKSVSRFYVTVVTNDAICDSYHLQCYLKKSLHKLRWCSCSDTKSKRVRASS